MRNLLISIIVLIFCFTTPFYAHGKKLAESQYNKLLTTDVVNHKQPVRARKGSNNFRVNVNLSKQKVFIYKNKKLVKTISCSSGIPNKDNKTPTGHFKINDYSGLSFYNNKYEEGAKYWVGFMGAEYLFHSVPTDKNGQIIQREANKIGTAASHGCIRLPMSDALWFYETIPEGTDVFISK